MESEVEQRSYVLRLPAGTGDLAREMLLEWWEREWRRRLGGGDHDWIPLGEQDGYERYALACSEVDWARFLRRGEEIVVVEAALRTIEDVLGMPETYQFN